MPHISLLDRVAHLLYSTAHNLPQACEMEPPIFEQSVDFYVFKCPMAARNVDLKLNGTNLYFANGTAISSTTISVSLEHYQKPQIMDVLTCDDGVQQVSAATCKQFSFDIYRIGGDIASLAMLGVTSTGLMTLTPNFDPSVTNYSTEVPQHVDFAISASSKEDETRVGIQFVDAEGEVRQSASAGLGSSNGCELGMRKHSIWEIKGIKTISELTYQICALAPDGIHMRKYTLKVKVQPIYSVNLKSLTPAGYKLDPPFDPKVQSYIIEIKPGVMKVPIQMEAEDAEAALSFAVGSEQVVALDKCEEDTGGTCHIGYCARSRNATCNRNNKCVCRPGMCNSGGRCVKPHFSKTPRGHSTFPVQMHDNDHLKHNEPPQWSTSLTIFVTSADGAKSMSYMVTIKQIVSKFCKLGGITANICDLKPEFDPDIFDYTCSWWWDGHPWAAFTPHLNLTDCSDCQLKLPDPDLHHRRHLALQYQSMDTSHWQFAGEPEKMWNRTFLYGESHNIPITVISADKFTHKVYNVRMTRECPWWMATSTTRLISTAASRIATFMAVSSAGNLMALAKQLQFLSLTTEIEGIPVIFSDFAESLKSFNFDLTQYLPDFGLPTMKDFEKYKEKMINKLRKKAGIADTRLLLQYCYALETYGSLHANSILAYHPQDAEELMKSLEDLSTKEDTKKETTDHKDADHVNHKTQRRLSNGFSVHNATYRRLRGGLDEVGDGSVLLEPLPLSGLDDGLSWRRLGGDKDEDEDEDKMMDETKEHDYDDVFQWSNTKWLEFIDMMQDPKKREHPVTEKSFDKLDCNANMMIKTTVDTLNFMHKISVIREMLHSTTGAFLVAFFALTTLGTLYFTYYTFFMRKVQKRLQVLEPMVLWIFILDYALISFAKHSAKIIFQDTGMITLFFFQPRRWMVVTFCSVGLVVYPLLFVVATLFMVRYLTTSRKLVFDEDQGIWLDPRCQEMCITVRPKVPPIPPLPQLLTRTLRSIIPVLDEEGEDMAFGDEQAFVLAKTIVRVKRDLAPIASIKDEVTNPHDRLHREAIGFVKESNEDGAIINFGGTEYAIPQDHLKALQSRIIKKDMMVVVIKTFNKLDEGTRGKVIKAPEFSDDQGLLLTVSFGEKVHRAMIVSGENLSYIVPEQPKKSKAKGRKAWLKQQAMEKSKATMAAEVAERNVKGEKLLHLNQLASESRKSKELGQAQEDLEAERKGKHAAILEALQNQSTQMAYSEGDGVRKGAVFFNIKFDLSTDRNLGLDLEEKDSFISEERVLCVKSVKNEGAAKAWNESQPKKIKPGDEIVQVNLEVGVPHDIQKEMDSADELEIRLRRPGKGKHVATSPPWLWNDIKEFNARLSSLGNHDASLEAYMADGNKGWNKIMPLGDLVATYESIKGRDDSDRLEPEERFALIQYIRTTMNEEQRLLQYNIMQVLPQDGYLKPKEPMVEQHKYLDNGDSQYKPDPVLGDVPMERWWLNLHDYNNAGGKFGSNKWLMQHTKGAEYIENAGGDRLVYMGTDGRWYHSIFAPAGKESGQLQWMPEPEEGWDAWEEKESVFNPEKGSMRYADKWQWLLMDKWERPWLGDEEAEDEVKCCCVPIPKDSIPFYKIYKQKMIEWFKERIPFAVDRVEKMEMRKWMWAELNKAMDMKLRLAWVAAQHPKFYNGQTIEEMARTPFKKVLFDIEHARANPKTKLPHEANQETRHELLDFVLMKFEDMFDNETEPWWGECDQPSDGEKRVMFDHDTFFMTTSDELLNDRVAENDLIPQHGYFTSPAFQQHPDVDVGVKRYKLLKPDSTETPCTMKVQLAHVNPLMRYTSRFKLNVPVEALELPAKTSWRIVIGEAGKYEKYMYGIDRFTTLFSIVVLSSKQTGMATCLVFLVMRFVTFATQFYAKVASADDEEEEEETVEGTYIKVGGEEENEEGGFGELPEEKMKKLLARVGGKSLAENAWIINTLAAFSHWRVMVPFLQVVTLGFLCFSLNGNIPPPVCALICIGLSSFNMLYMNLSTLGSSLSKLKDEAVAQVLGVMKTFNTWSFKITQFLSGENPLGIKFISDSLDKGANVKHANSINIVVPQLGLMLEGKPDIDETLPREEQMAMTMSKKMAYYVHRRESTEDARPTSVKDIYRFEKDISSSLNVALQVDQLMLRKAIPQIMATIQCVNHSTSKLTRPQYDSFLTLFKPEDWEEDDDLDKERVEAMLRGWQKEVSQWMREELGAIHSDRTCSAGIHRELMSLLRAECTQDVHRRIRRVRVGSVRLPERDLPRGSNETKDLDGKLACMMVVYETEQVTTDYPTMRSSGYGRVQRVQPIEFEFEAKLVREAKTSGLEFTLHGGELVISKLNGGMAQIWNDANSEMVAITEGDRVISIDLDGQTMDSRDESVFAKKGIITLQLQRENGVQEPFVVILDMTEVSWGFEWALAKDGQTVSIQSIGDRGAMTEWNDSALETGLIRLGDTILKANNKTGKDIMIELSKEGIYEISLSIKNSSTGISMLPGHRIRSEPFLGPETMTLVQAREKAASYHRCQGFYIEGDRPNTDTQQVKVYFCSDWRGLGVEIDEKCCAFRLERDKHIRYHCQIDSIFDVPIPLNVNKVRLAIWVQCTKEAGVPKSSSSYTKAPTDEPGEADWPEAWEELVGFTSELDLFNMTNDDDVQVHTKWQQTGKYTIQPWGGETKEDNVDESKDDESARGCCSSFASRVSNTLMPAPTSEQIIQHRGFIRFSVEDDEARAQEAEEEDFRAQLAMKDVLAGDSTMNIEKLKRHKDRWIDLAKMFGVYGYMRAGKNELKEIKAHWEKLKDLKAAINGLDHSAQEKKCIEAGVRRQLAKSEINGNIVMVVNEAKEFSSSPEVKAAVKEAFKNVIVAATGVNAESKDFKLNVLINFRDSIKIDAQSRASQGVDIAFTADIGRDALILKSALKPEEKEDAKKTMMEKVADKASKAVGLDGPPIFTEIKRRLSPLSTGNGLAYNPELARFNADTEMDLAILNMGKDIEKITARQTEHERKNVNPVPPHVLTHRRIGYHVHALPTSHTYVKVLLEALWAAQRQATESSKQILHYVMLSDHLKPGKNWRPDAISPHVACIVTNEYEHVPEVIVTGGPFAEAVTFKRELKQQGAKEPAIINGRLVYKAVEDKDGVDKLSGFPRWSNHDGKLDPRHELKTGKMTLGQAKAEAAKILKCIGFTYKGKVESDSDEIEATFFKEWRIQTKQEFQTTEQYTSVRKNALWLYWDGQSRWVMSYQKGHPPPYGLKGQGADAFMWSKDHKAMTPDHIVQPWHAWKTSEGATGGKMGSWSADTTVLIDNPLDTGTRKKNEMILNAEKELADQRDIDVNDSLSGMALQYVTDALWEVLSLFDTGRSQQVNPSLKDCLVSLSSNRATFCWKDSAIERLAPFRRFLLAEFGTYQAAWCYITSSIQMPRSLARRNLALMFYRTKLELEQIDKDARARLDTALEANDALKAVKNFKEDRDVGKFKDAISMVRESKLQEILENSGWDGLHFYPGSDIIKEDGEERDAAFARLVRDIDHVARGQGVIVDSAHFTIELACVDANRFNDMEAPALDLHLREVIKAKDVQISPPLFQVHLDYNVTAGKASLIPQTTIKDAVAAVYNIKQSAVSASCTDKNLSVVVSTRDEELATNLKEDSHDNLAVSKLQDKLKALSTAELKLSSAGEGHIFTRVKTFVKTLPEDNVAQNIKNLTGGHASRGGGVGRISIMSSGPANKGNKQEEVMLEIRSVTEVVFDQEAVDPRTLEDSKPGPKTEATRSGRGSARSFESFQSVESLRSQAVTRKTETQNLREFLQKGEEELGIPDMSALEKDKADLDKRLAQKAAKDGKTVDDTVHRSSGTHDAQDEFEALAAHIVDRLDADRSGTVEVAELHALYEEDTTLDQVTVTFQMNVEPAQRVALLDVHQRLFVDKVLVKMLEGELQSSLTIDMKGSTKANLDYAQDDGTCKVCFAVAPPVGVTADDVKNRCMEIRSKFMLEASQKITNEEIVKTALDGENVKFTDFTEPEIRKPDGLLEAFRIFLQAHPKYKRIEWMWADLSEDVEVQLDEFVEALQAKMHKFYDPMASQVTSKEKAQLIFTELDAQLSDGVTLRELIPSSGETLNEVDQSLLTFHVPLMQFKEIRLEGHKKMDGDKQCLRFVMNSQFEGSKEWSALRTALNPDWEVKPGNESLEICMTPLYFDLWRQVIRESEMVVPQEFIRHFNGGYQDHPLIGGTYMRECDRGVQRWVDGRVYDGGWKNHVYEGHGKLYESVQDHQHEVNEIYSGSWFKGKRHGKGILRWEQDINDRKAGNQTLMGRSQQVGISKRYSGEFRDDLFHGKGILELEKAVAQTLRTRSVTANHRPGYAPMQQVEPSQLLRFEGIFDADWDETDRALRKIDPHWETAYPELRRPKTTAEVNRSSGDASTPKSKRLGFLNAFNLMAPAASTKLDPESMMPAKDLDLDRVSKQDRRNEKSMGFLKFNKYFPLDNSRVQKSGAALPDIAMAAYSLHNFRTQEPGEAPSGGFDTKHMKVGTGTYADGTTYNGDYKDGRPHGFCKEMVQYEVTLQGTTRKIASYTGHMAHGAKNGPGKYRVFTYDRETGEQIVAYKVEEVTSKGVASELMQSTVGLLYSKDMTQDGDGILSKKEMEGHTDVEVWSTKTNKFVAMWGTTVSGTLTEDGKWLKVKADALRASQDMYLPLSIKPTGLFPRSNLRPVLMRAEDEDGLLYDGNWKDNRRHGRGTQVVPFHLREIFGYWTYSGEWERDQRHGIGEMTFGDLGEYLYHGPFTHDVREGGPVEQPEAQPSNATPALLDTLYQAIVPVTMKTSNNFGRVYLKEKVREDEQVLLQSGFAKFISCTGTLSGTDIGEEEIMTISEAMQKVVTLKGCKGFTVENADIWKTTTPISFHDVVFMSDAQRTETYRVRFQRAAKIRMENDQSNRTSFCRTVDYMLLLNGRFKDDTICAMPLFAGHIGWEDAWSHFVLPGERRGRYYFGQLTQDGQRQGVGTLYDEDASEEPTFKECFEGGNSWASSDRPHPSTWNLTPETFKSNAFDGFLKDYCENGNYTKLEHVSYHGQWRDNLPHGDGVQHFLGSSRKGGGTYVGQFVAGRRHGRGLWITNDGHWRYRPIEQKGVPNWENDMMHGVAIVEDPKHVHENVIYTKGQCQMPFTDMGPPLTGFDQTRVLGTVVQSARKGRSAKSMELPGMSLVSGYSKGRQAKQQEDHVEGIDPTETRVLAKAGTARGISAAQRSGKALSTAGSAMTLGSLKSMSSAPGSMASMEFVGEEEDDTLALVREPTDLNLPEEDVFISGGTGDNEILNGLFFKLTGTFGVPIYRLVKREGIFTTYYTDRFLFRDTKSNCWIISGKSTGGISIQPGCAFTEGDEQERPGDAQTPWYVWHAPSKTMKNMAEELSRLQGDDKALAILKKTPVDQISIRSIVGFELSGIPKGFPGPVPGLMLRHASQFFGRPVYEGESGAQYLYWMKNGADLAEGLQDELAPGETQAAKKLFEGSGYWAMGKEVGLGKDDPSCFCYIVDDNVTPHQINEKAIWQLKTADKKGWIAVPEMKLVMEEWNRNNDIMDNFDREDSLFGAPANNGTAASSSSAPIASSAQEPSAATPLLAR